MAWEKIDENHYTYTTITEAMLEVRLDGELSQVKFDNWWLTSETLEELITALQFVKDKLNG